MKISVITAVRNARDTVAYALESALAQDHPDIELIVVDGASTDGTLDALRPYEGRITRLVSEPDIGPYDAMNKGLALATGEAVGFLHADDCYADTRVLSRIAAALEDPGVDACYGDLLYVGRDDPSRVIRRWQADPYHPRLLARGWMPPHPTFYAKRSVYERFGGFDLGYRIAGDYDCLLRFLGTGRVECVYIPEILVHMRTGGTSNGSLGNILHKSVEDYRALRCNCVGGIWTLLLKNLRKLPQFL